MRKRSMSVFVSREDNRQSKRFEVSSDVETHSDSEDEEITAKIGEAQDHVSESWTKADYDLLVEKLRGALPKKDVKKAKSTLQNIKWEDIEIRQHSSEDIRQVAHSLLAKIRTFRTLGEILNDVPDVVSKILSVDKPKLPLSAYTIFMKEQIPIWRAENPEFKQMDAFKLASKAYHELSPKKKKKYEDLAAKSKLEYQELLAKYYEDHPDMVPVPKPTKSSGRGGRSRDPTAKLRRERTRTPFNLFYESRLEKEPSVSMQQCRAEWEQLPVKNKLPFIKQSFQTTDDLVGASKLLNKKEQEMLDRFHGKPEFVGRNAFDYYRRQNRGKYDAELSGKEREQKLCDDYKKLSDRKLLDLKVAFLAARDDYVKQYQAYIKQLPEDKQKQEIEYLQGQIASGSASRKDKSRKDKKPKEDELYPGSGDEDPPVAESTTIKKPPKEKKSSKKKHAAPVEEDLDEDDDQEAPVPSPTKRTKMEPPPASPKKTVTSTPKPAPAKEPKGKKNAKPANSSRLESSSAEDSEASTSKNGSRSSRKRSPEVVPATKVAVAAESKKGAKKAAKKEKLVEVPPTPAIKEPERPPTVLEEFYRQRVYKGKVGKHKESFANLSAAKRREISDQMKAAQKQYIVEFETFLKSLPKDQIRQYIQKVNSTKKAPAAADDSDDEEEESETGTSGSDEESEDDD